MHNNPYKNWPKYQQQRAQLERLYHNDEVHTGLETYHDFIDQL